MPKLEQRSLSGKSNNSPQTVTSCMEWPNTTYRWTIYLTLSDHISHRPTPDSGLIRGHLRMETSSLRTLRRTDLKISKEQLGRLTKRTILISSHPTLMSGRTQRILNKHTTDTMVSILRRTDWQRIGVDSPIYLGMITFTKNSLRRWKSDNFNLYFI